MTVGPNTEIFIFDQVWNDNVNNAYATTIGTVQYYDAANGILDINNLANTSNYELDFGNFEVDENLYLLDSNTTVTYSTLTNILYLARPPEPEYIPPEIVEEIINCACCDSSSSANGANNMPEYTGCWGFQPGDCVEQRLPDRYVITELTEDEIQEICNSCGCGTGCSCTEEEIESIRYVPVLVRGAELVRATVVREDCANNALYVKDVTGEFVKNYPICKCGGLSDTEIQTLCESCGCGGGCDCTDIEALQFVQPCAEVVGVFADPQPRFVIDGNYLVERKQWDPLGPFIGIDKHFTGKRTQDYSDKYLVLSNSEKVTPHPICIVSGDNGEGNRW